MSWWTGCKRKTSVREETEGSLYTPAHALASSYTCHRLNGGMRIERARANLVRQLWTQTTFPTLLMAPYIEKVLRVFLDHLASLLCYAA
jgi:hypothetical protein